MDGRQDDDLLRHGSGDHADAAGFDLTGTWDYAFGNPTVSGRPCEVIGAGPAFSGLLEITQDGGAIAMSFGSGATCNPESMCHCTGEIVDGYLVVFNHDTSMAKAAQADD